MQRSDQWSRGVLPPKSMSECVEVCVCVCLCVLMFVYFECCVLPSRGLCDRRITGPDECVCVCRFY